MPQNNLLGQKEVVVDVIAQAAYAFSPGDTHARLSLIPLNGTAITLPANPSSGDHYAFGDGDGSCSGSHPVTLAASAGQTVQGGQPSVSFGVPFSWCVAIYDEASSDWFLRYGTVGPGTASLLQGAWFVDNINGNDNADGKTALTPVKTYQQIKNRWDGGISGRRLTLPVNTTITILQGYATASAAKADALSRLLDVNLGGNVQLLIQQNTTQVAAGVFSAVGAFARTSGGRQTVADAVFNTWAAQQDQLIVDTTLGSVAWVNDTAGGPIGVTSAPYQAVVPAVPATTTMIRFVAGNAWQIVQPNGFVYIGTHSDTRADSRQLSLNTPQVILYRLREAIEATPAVFGDPMSLTTDGVAQIFMVECGINQNPVPSGAVTFVNCALYGSGVSGVVTQVSSSVTGGSFGAPAPDAIFKAGYSVATNMVVQSGAVGLFEDDFQLLGGRIAGASYSYVVEPSAVALFGKASRPYTTAGVNAGAPACSSGGLASFGLADDSAGASVFYGDTLGGAVCLQANSPAGSIIYAPNGGTPAASSFNLSTLLIKLGGATSAYGWDPAAGVFVGPTTLTFAHLDAALGAGTGFGSMAIEPKTATRMGLQT